MTLYTNNPNNYRKEFIMSKAIRSIAAKTLGTKALRPIVVTDVYGLDWDFGDKYAIDRDGKVVSFARKKPALLKNADIGGYPISRLSIEGELLQISTAQIVAQVFGSNLRLSGYIGMVRKNKKPGSISLKNLRQAKHANHVYKALDAKSPQPQQGQARVRRIAFDG